MAGVYTVKIVDVHGTVYDTLSDATDISRIEWELNGPGSAEFSLPTSDPTVAAPQFSREAQIWRDGTLIWWGPIVRPEVTIDRASWQCAGLLWYFRRRNMGKADRTNELTNGDFESGTTGWTFNVVTGTADTTHVVNGTHSLKLTGGTTEGENFAHQIWTHPAGGYPGGDFLTVNAYLWIDNATYVAPALGLRGLYAERRNSGGDLLDVQFTVLDDDTPRDVWNSLEVGIAEVGAGDTIDVRLYAPNGTCWWDLATLTFMESLSFGFPGPGTDVADIVGGIVDYAQDRGSFTHGKSDLNIDHAGGPVGTTRQIAYQFAEHRNIWDAINEYIGEGDFDVDVVLTSTTRTFTIYAPRKGSYKTGDALTLDSTIQQFRWSWDGEEASTDVVVTGQGAGPDRPEGGANNRTVFGGLTLEHVESAGENVLVGQLDEVAAEILRVKQNPAVIEATCYPHSPIINDLVCGDTVPVAISHGPLAVAADYRVVKVSLDPHTDQATYTLNPV